MTASDETKKPGIKLVEASAPESIFDDIDALRKVSPLTVQRKQIVTNVTAGKPPSDCYFRVHPDPEMRLGANVAVGPGGRDDLYFVTPKMCTFPPVAKRLRPVTLALIMTWPGSELQIFVVPQLTRIKCWRTLQTALERGQEEWIQLAGWDESKGKGSGGGDYILQAAEGDLPAPQWPADIDFGALLKIAFDGKVISSPEDDIVRQWRGLPD
jgi:hypothetical protein